MIGVVKYRVVAICYAVDVDGEIVEANLDQHLIGKHRTQVVKIGSTVELRPPIPGGVFRTPFITKVLDSKAVALAQSKSKQQPPKERIVMSYANAIATVLANYPIGNHTDAEFRGILVLAGKLATALGTSGTGKPAKLTLEFLAAQLDDSLLVERCRSELNYLLERESR